MPNHYNLYEDLDLHRAAGPEELRQALSARLAALNPDDDVNRDKLTVATSVLGEPHRRALYDRELDDPNAPEITIRRLREIAESPVSPPIGQQARAQTASDDPWLAATRRQRQAPTSAAWGPSNAVPATGQTTQFHASMLGVPANRPRCSSIMWTIGWAVIFLAWLLLLVLLLFGNKGSDQGLFDSVSYAGGLFAIAALCILHTIAVLVFCQLLWNIRVLIGRKYQ